MNITKLVLLIIFVGCSSNLSPESENLYRVGGKANSKIAKELMLIPTGIGGSIPEKITEYSVFFDFPYPMTIEQGRYLVLRSADIAIHTFNNDPGIQEFLETKPFDNKNLTIAIFSESFMDNSAPEGLAQSVSLIQDTIYYGYYDHKLRHFVNFYEESYDEASAKLAEDHSNTLSPSTSAPKY